MKVGIVEFVENEMVELDMAQIGSNWGWIEVECGDENDYGSVECGIECGISPAEKPIPTTIPHNNTLNNKSKPIVPAPSLSLQLPIFLSITFHYSFITSRYNSLSFSPITSLSLL